MNVLCIYIGPYLKFPKKPDVSPGDWCTSRLASTYLPDEKDFDIWTAYGDKQPAGMSYRTDHRECGNDYFDVDKVQQKMKQFREYAAREIAQLTELYGAQPTFHFGVVTSWG